MGDGYLALPTLIHRGPGNAASASEPRFMLFFTLRPVYKNTIESDALYHKYNQDLQIHAGKCWACFLMSLILYAGVLVRTI